MAKKKDITSMVFGNLKAVKCTGQKNNGSYLWEFECLLCGKKVVKRINTVTSGAAVSCGCKKIRNLRTKTIQEKLGQINNTNISKISSNKIQKNNTSGYRGVSLHRQKGKSDRWIAYIYFMGIRYHLGSYQNIEEAIKARKDAEEATFGEFLDWYKKNKS